MSPGSLVVLALVLVILFLFAVGNIEYSLPFFQRIKFDNICNKYLAIVQAEGGLSMTDRNNLTSELENIGFNNVIIIAPTNRLAWNSEATLRVEADYTFKVTKGNLSKDNKTIRAVYENKTRVMTLER